ncbi:TPA: EAL domain-containing protein [Kluyvera intermedia]|uniref:EAL domain-containing protein n=2 Tax=Enterobacterales TaxID=91347 RepID=A0A9P3WFW0_KLUIN|nr:EAL domain-containing protein [Kluyvera intermedia]HAT2514110.1 EAL domain-containing protein [Kluyvera intermedia]HAT2603016.1 EAL domain-containing protein [Kluyvera intermedia]HAT2679884.1 EAL domain-containing protein [Kluyvera intermedia]HAT2696294.1 EAL domain-containing protein [Kluyvera intermedia]
MLIMEPQMLCRLKHDLLASNISLHFQPVYSAATQKIVGFEALLRWSDSRFGHVCPETPIGLAVVNGLMSTVSLYVIKRVIAEMAPLLSRHAQRSNTIAGLTVREQSSPAHSPVRGRLPVPRAARCR